MDTLKRFVFQLVKRHMFRILALLALLFMPAVAFAGAGQWTSIGLQGLFIATLAVDSVTPSTLYAGTDSGLYKSTDSGVTWITINSGLVGSIVTALAIDPATPTTLYAGTNSLFGVRESPNGGVNWLATGGQFTSVVLTLAIDQTTPSTLYVGSTSSGGGIFKSTDGGNNWINNLPNTWVNSLAIDPKIPSTIYAATWGSRGILKSTNSGVTWGGLNTGLPFGANVTKLAIDPVNPNNIYAGSNGFGLIKSTDNGKNWAPINSGLPIGANVAALAINPTTPTTVYVGIGTQVFTNTDGGTNWTAISTGLTNNFVQDIGIDPITPTNIYAALGTFGGGGGVFKYTTVSANKVDLAVTKTATPNPVQVGNNLTYTVTVTNLGPTNPATGVTLTDTLPTGVAFVSATPTQGTCNVVGVTVTCNLNNVSTATPATISIIVTPAQAGQITNTTTVAGNETDPISGNNTAQAVTTVNSSPPLPTAGTDLVVTKIDTPDPVLQGQNLTYIIQATNNGPDAASGVTVVDSLPTGVTFSSAVSTQGACSQSTGTMTCNVGALANGASATITLVITPTTAGTIFNTATVAGNETDPISGNNTAQAVTTVISAPPPTVTTVTLGLSSLSFSTGSTLTLTGTTVAGVPSTNADIYLALQLPGGALFVMQPGGAFGSALVPVLSNIQVPDFTGSIFSYTFTGLEPVGTYSWFAALAQPGTLNVIGSITQASFTFSP